ncbi:MAG TPA: DUF72 domain-containing protein [Anaeromyxobacter sp.]|nr:DUF72 domain-containing protein [Anaeromyxobacter sp.]
MAFRIGTSGYQYGHRRGISYPAGLPRGAFLSPYASFFDTVELNATFYRLPTPTSVDFWRHAVPERFVDPGTGAPARLLKATRDPRARGLRS